MEVTRVEMYNRWLDNLFQTFWAPQAGSHCFKNTHRENKKMKYNKFLYLPYLIYWNWSCAEELVMTSVVENRTLGICPSMLATSMGQQVRHPISTCTATEIKLNFCLVIDEQGIHIKYEQNYSRIKFAGKGFTEPLSRPLRLNQAPLQTPPTPPSPSPDPSDFIEPFSRPLRLHRAPFQALRLRRAPLQTPPTSPSLSPDPSDSTELPPGSSNFTEPLSRPLGLQRALSRPPLTSLGLSSSVQVSYSIFSQELAQLAFAPPTYLFKHQINTLLMRRYKRRKLKGLIMYELSACLIILTRVERVFHLNFAGIEEFGYWAFDH